MAVISWANMPAWAREREDMMDTIVRQATQETIAIAQRPKAKGGPMPVVTSFLRNSMVSEIHGGVSIKGGEAYVLAIASMEAGDVASFAWGADYARVVNDGQNGRVGARFMDTAALQWGATVSGVVRQVRWGG